MVNVWKDINGVDIQKSISCKALDNVCKLYECIDVFTTNDVKEKVEKYV